MIQPMKKFNYRFVYRFIPLLTLKLYLTYCFNGQNNGSSNELVQVIVAREFSEILSYVVHIEGLYVLLKCCLEFVAEFLVGEGLVPQIVDLVIKWLKREHI